MYSFTSAKFFRAWMPPAVAQAPMVISFFDWARTSLMRSASCGVVIDPSGLDRLLPEWRSEDTPVTTAVADDRFYWLTAGSALRLPKFSL